jgi:hypothetical protein
LKEVAQKVFFQFWDSVSSFTEMMNNQQVRAQERFFWKKRKKLFL